MLDLDKIRRSVGIVGESEQIIEMLTFSLGNGKFPLLVWVKTFFYLIL